jgi:hypothetical protein
VVWVVVWVGGVVEVGGVAEVVVDWINRGPVVVRHRPTEDSWE